MGLLADRLQRKVPPMNQTDVMLRVIEMARVGGTMPADEAVSLIAQRINRLDALSDSYERDVYDLLRLGATIWDLAGLAGKRA